MSKGSARRPGEITEDRWNAIFKKPTPPSKCPVCNENIPRCVCNPTDDGPGQEGGDAATEAKADYERRRFERN